MNVKARLLSATAAATILVAGAAATLDHVSAQEPQPTAGIERQRQRGQFFERIADKLNITVEELKAAMQAAAMDAIDEAVADGRMTQEQATKARERIESGKGPGQGSGGHHDRRGHRRDLVRRAIMESSATALDMTFDELKTKLMAGNSIADVAGGEGVSLDAVKTQITSDAEKKLDEAVANGKLTQEKADAALAKLTEKLDEILNKSKPSTPAQ